MDAGDSVVGRALEHPEDDRSKEGERGADNKESQRLCEGHEAASLCFAGDTTVKVNRAEPEMYDAMHNPQGVVG